MATENLYSRNIRANISYNQDDTEVDISESIINAKVDEIACSGNVLKMGEFCKNSIEFEYNPSLLKNPSIFWNNKKLNVSLQYEYIYQSESTFPSSERYMYKTISLGKFYVNADDVETSNNGSTYVVTAYDLPTKMSDIYDTESSPNDSIDILHKIASDTGMTFANIDIISSFKIESVPEGTTYAGMVAYIAGYEGYNARVNSSGEIEFYWYFDKNIDTSTLYTIKREVQYLNGFSIKETLASINAVMSGKADTESETGSSKYTAGSGEALTYDNPYITQEKVTEIYNRIKGFTYCVGDLKWRADQNVRAGDLVRVETKPGEYVLFPVMEYSMTVDGGLVGNSISYTYVVQNNVMGSTPSDKKLSNVYKNLTEAFKKQTGIIKMNEKAGFYRLLIDDETGFPYGWVIADSEEITETTKGWMWTQGGLMHSSDGFRTADKIAFTQDGQLSAEMISANSITLGNLNVDALNKIEGAYDYADQQAQGALDTAKSYSDTGDSKTLGSAKSYADTSAQNAVNAQTQDFIFNKLTNNGTVKGIILTDGKLYINADYITSGILNANLLRAGIIKSAKNENNYWDLDTGEFKLQAIDNMLVGSTNLINGTINDTYITAGGNNEEYFVVSDNLEQGQPYILSFEATSNDTNKVTVINRIPYSSSGKEYTVEINNGRSYVYINASESNPELDIFCGIKGQTAWKTVKLHHIMLEKGTVPSDWAPSPDDLMSTVADLSQEDIFNKLTNNGQTQGIYLQNGKIYLNAEYIKSGTLNAINIKGSNISGGTINGTEFTTDKQIKFVNDGHESIIYASKATSSIDNVERPCLMFYSSDFDFHGTRADPLKSFAVNSNYFSFYMYEQIIGLSHAKNNVFVSGMTMSDNGVSVDVNSDLHNSYFRLYKTQAWLSSDDQMIVKGYGKTFLKSIGNGVYIQARNSDDNDDVARLYLQNDGKVFLNGSLNKYTYINGYPAVRVNGTYHDIFFQWNGASLIATVDVTQVWSTSDRRLKDQIDRIADDYIDAIGSAEIKQFIFTDEIYDQSIKHFGVIAQDVREALESKGINPEEIAVNNHFDRDGTEYYGIDKDEFYMARIAYDEKKIKMLEERIERLEKLILKES